MELLLPGITLVFFILFWIVYKRNKATVLAGFIFDLFLVSAVLVLLYYAVQQERNILIVGFLMLGAFLFAFLLFFGLYILIALLLWNARLVFKRERHTLANSLTLILALALLLFVIVSFVMDSVQTPRWIQAVWSGIVAVLIFYVFHVLVFLTTVILCNCARPRLNQDYIIVLGSGLVNGKVSPLLAGRIEKAMKFAGKQIKKTNKVPVLLLSGGRGTNEQRAEGEAMREYAREHGYDAGHLLAETESANTRENMLFSKKIMDAKNGPGAYHCIFVSSNYHVFRAGVYARQAGLSIDGLGAKTAWYYVPNALLREYIAFLGMHKKRFIITALALFLSGVGLAALSFWI